MSGQRTLWVNLIGLLIGFTLWGQYFREGGEMLMKIWPRVDSNVFPCPLCDSKIALNHVACGHCGLPLPTLTKIQVSESIPAGRTGSWLFRRRLRDEKLAIATTLGLVLICLLGLGLTSDPDEPIDPSVNAPQNPVSEAR